MTRMMTKVRNTESSAARALRMTLASSDRPSEYGTNLNSQMTQTSRAELGSDMRQRRREGEPGREDVDEASDDVAQCTRSRQAWPRCAHGASGTT